MNKGTVFEDDGSKNRVIAINQLKGFIERIERLEEEKKSLNDDIKDIFAEVKGNGFDVKAVKVILKLRKIEEHERVHQEEILQLYKDALDMN